MEEPLLLKAPCSCKSTEPRAELGLGGIQWPPRGQHGKPQLHRQPGMATKSQAAWVQISALTLEH